MGILNSLRNIFGGKKAEQARPTPPPDPEPDEIQVPEVSAPELLAALKNIKDHECPLLIDVREAPEWKLTRIPSTSTRPVLHIPMNTLPKRLAEVPKDKAIIVFCAHGSRSYGVAAWLIEQGYNARSLAGGITQWHVQGGDVETGEASGGGAGGWR